MQPVREDRHRFTLDNRQLSQGIATLRTEGSAYEREKSDMVENHAKWKKKKPDLPVMYTKICHAMTPQTPFLSGRDPSGHRQSGLFRTDHFGREGKGSPVGVCCVRCSMIANILTDKHSKNGGSGGVLTGQQACFPLETGDGSFSQIKLNAGSASRETPALEIHLRVSVGRVVAIVTSQAMLAGQTATSPVATGEGRGAAQSLPEHTSEPHTPSLFFVCVIFMRGDGGGSIPTRIFSGTTGTISLFLCQKNAFRGFEL